MLVGSQSFSPGGPNGIIRSQSFAGFSGLQERRSRCNSFIENPSALKKPQAKLKKMHNLGHKNNNPPKEPQPKRVEEVVRALKNGLDEYLEVHQTELDKLTAQLKDMRRNSRLGVLYDLDKQIKTIERYMRRLEFHISKVDELYEAYCIQRRLQDGASKMKQAFAASPASRAARESLSEISRSYREYTENMCAIEAELENLLGEFSIKMKGLAGFARLCPGDQYEIFMKYGRQRWKLKGRIEANGKQSWDGEEVVFLPLIVGFISIKVTELKGLATHLLVGSVTCETKELFAARPQVVAVDINDLGTIKLSLEISWYPFDVEDMAPSSGAGSKAAALQRRMSMYSQGTPETPTLKDHSFFRWLRPPADRPRRLSVLSAWQDTFLAKLHCSRSLSDLPSLRLRPKAGLEFYVSAGGLPAGKCLPWGLVARVLWSVRFSRFSVALAGRRLQPSCPWGGKLGHACASVRQVVVPVFGEPRFCAVVFLRWGKDIHGNKIFIFKKPLTLRSPSCFSPYRSVHPEARGHLSEALTEDTGVGTSVAGSPLPLTTGNESLDITIVRHLQYCTQLVQQIVFSSKTPFVASNLLEKLSRQVQVMEKLSAVSDENIGNISSVIEAIPEFHKKLSLLSFWTRCCSPVGVYHSSADRVMKQLEASFARTVNREYPGLADPVFRTLVSQILDQAEPLLPSSLSSEVITVFQYYGYFTSHGVSDLESYLNQLAKQVSLIQTLQSLRDEKLLQAMSDLALGSLSAQQEVLGTLAVLLTGDNQEAREAVMLYLTAASRNEHFREKALLYYCEALTKANPQLQKAACLALKSLQATESIKMLVTLCQCDTEEIRNVASETLLSLGEDGRLAYEQLDKFPRDRVNAGGRHGAEVATAF
ncbi:rho family-interacting cell polarization regulator 2 [Panthera uncia]|uniref:rho family-interacting cell polarization regulator 2 n=1 Tax=Panthera uncia TaxID=29064 RepID=UPI0020FFB3ED|nr:rho family-interacting cell polarization regulator 2 [Panthera uncia]